MGLMLLKKNIGQNTLEITLAIIIGIMLLLGAISVWNWFNKSMSERLDTYKASRHVAASTQFGNQSVYTPEPLNIFCMTSTVNPAPGGEVPTFEEDPEYQHCYEEFNATLLQSQILLNESINDTIEAGMLLAEYTILKGELGNFTVISALPYWIDEFKDWLFPGGEITYSESDFEEIGAQFLVMGFIAVPYPPYVIPDPNLGYQTNEGDPITAPQIITDYIDVGIDLEDSSEAKAEEASQEMQQSEELLQQAPTNLTLCLEGELPPSDPCRDQCYEDYGLPAEQLSQQANSACYGGDVDLCQQLLNETQTLSLQYADCLDGC